MRDLLRVVGGFTAWLRYLVTTDRVRISLGQFSAEPHVAAGCANPYTVMISSSESEPRELTLLVDIYAMDSPTHPDGHYAHFSKRLKARPRGVTRVEVDYDWRTAASFRVHGTRSPADDLWRGSVDRPTRYAVTAMLHDTRGERLELLTVHQELGP